MEKMSGRYESVNYSCIVEFKKMQVLDFESDFEETIEKEPVFNDAKLKGNHIQSLHIAKHKGL